MNISLKNKILFTTLLIQCCVLIVMFWPYKGGSNSLNTFANITTNSFESLYILDSNSNSTLIGFANNQCVLIDSENYPCNSDKLNLFFELINKFDEGELISTTVDSHRTLKVHADIYERYVEINLTDGNIVKMYLGTTPRLRSTHFRLADSSNVYLSPNYTNSKFLAVANDWVETEYFDIEEDNVNSFIVNNQRGRNQFVKNESGDWLILDKSTSDALNQVKIKSILTKITSISLRKPVGIERKSEFGYDNANAIVEIFGSDSNGDNFSYILTVGGEFEGEGSNINDVLFYVKATNKDYWVLVPEYEVLEITEVDYDYFLK